jgi:hypothetical protein
MSTSIRDYSVIVYWAAYLALLMLPKILYRSEQKFGYAEVLREFPRYRRVLTILPRMTSGLTVLLLIVVFAMWLSPTYVQATTIHAIGIGYGALLVLDAAFAWITGIRSITGLHQRYVVGHSGTWQPMLQFALSMLYLAVPIALLLLFGS